MRIGLDIDDVLFPWSMHAHAACERAGITNGQAVTQWEPYLDYGCTFDDFWRVVYREYDRGMLTRAPFAYVRAALIDLKAAGHTLHLATARGWEPGRWAQVREATVWWLAQHGIPHDSLTFTRDKTMVAADVFLDDSVTNVRALRDYGVDAYLMDQCHNRGDDAVDLPRVATFAEFVERVDPQLITAK